MISYVKGIVAEKEPGRAVIEAGGLGYELSITLAAYEALPREGAEAKVLAWHCVRDDDEALFGFAGRDEKEMFLKLIGVSGVGPKLAITVLSGSTVGELSLAVSSGNAKRIAAIKGVGRKTAEKICVELKDKVDAIGALAAAGPRERASGAAGGARAPALRDAILALAALGFAEEAANKMVSAAIEENPSAENVEDIVRIALSGGARKAGGR